MNKKNCKYTKRGPKAHISIRISDDVKKWLKQNNFSPTAIFKEAINELGYDKND